MFSGGIETDSGIKWVNERFSIHDASDRCYGTEVSIIIKKYDSEKIILNDEIWYQKLCK